MRSESRTESLKPFHLFRISHEESGLIRYFCSFMIYVHSPAEKG